MQYEIFSNKLKKNHCKSWKPHLSEENGIIVVERYLCLMVIITLSTTSKTWKQPKGPVSNERLKKTNVVCVHDGIPLSEKLMDPCYCQQHGHHVE